MLSNDKALDRSAPGRYGLVQFLSWCQPRCSPKSSKDLKRIYMKFKERSCSRTDFLHSAADVIETPWLMNAMVANRIHAMQSDISMQNAASMKLYQILRVRVSNLKQLLRRARS